ncbi:hypothetical protein F3Y22_tig00116964pilonHSYRG00366 [Hibiscus syriacus]|uniref:SWIM-type domain-containing protein n=1 Tax=Hibiscus syriacus TaxID=106335 RepID=A0A6A2WV49_HIBSY|nr:hypothetical protein F3Y22_tig00116964pilonHSYRG00366 [Hibiscus syriacus]
MKFTGNKIAYFDLCDCDTISLLDICEMMEQILVPTPLQLFWLLPNVKLTKSSIMPLGSDSDVIKIVQSLPKNRYIHIYAQVKGINESGCYESGGVEVDNAESGGVEMDTAEMGIVERDNAEMGSVERDNAESGSVEIDSAESAGVEMDNVEMYNAEMGNVEMDNAEMGSVEMDNVESVSVEMDNAEMGNVERDNKKDKSSNEGVRGTEADFEEVGELNNDKYSDSDARPTFPEFNKETDMENPKFQKACKEGFKAGCRRIISLDGCFLKGYYVGYLLAAVGIDVNGGIYTIAYAIVESENQYSWLWFLEILGRDLDIDNSYGWCFMSDRQKGFVEAVAELFPDAEARNCIILEARDKPILTMMELIRTKIMRRIVCSYEAAEKINGPLCPNIQKKLNIIIDQVTRCWATHAGGLKYQVEYGPGNQHVVDMGSHSCSCRKWDLTGIPCIHSVAVIQLHNDRPEPYVHTCYHKSTQLAIYSNFICPVKGAKQWTSVTEMEPILPPELRRSPGRPTKKKGERKLMKEIRMDLN